MTLVHDVAGAGPALVLLHSGVGDRRMWEPQWPDLIDAGYRLVRCDFRGFGDTPPSDRPYNDADDVLEVLDTLGTGRVALVAASYGGRVAMEIAARRPDQIGAVALLCSGLAGHEASEELREFQQREAVLLDAGDIAGAVALNVETWLGPDAGGAVREEVRRMLRHSFDVRRAADEIEPVATEFDLSAVEAPCLVVSGGHDLVDFRLIAARLSGLLADSHHLELPWAGHLPSLERPAAVTELLLGFLDRCFNDAAER